MLLLAGWGQHWEEPNEVQQSHTEELDAGLLQVLGMIAVQAFIYKVFINKYLELFVFVLKEARTDSGMNPTRPLDICVCVGGGAVCQCI